MTKLEMAKAAWEEAEAVARAASEKVKKAMAAWAMAVAAAEAAELVARAASEKVAEAWDVAKVAEVEEKLGS